ncbi:cathelicidin antimicrobial peptide [Castor canadensis]|uniref:Cathelicidin antimicrobial peptide n=1 Tax=Castor canadensis TaxID=51338 RepID=A0A8B7WAG7_CASCN
MYTQRDGPFLGQWSLLLLLLGLLIPPATAQTLSYQEAVLRAVDGFNQRSLDDNLYRLLTLESRPPEDEDPDTPKPVRFTVKETVCPKTTQQPLQQCDFKKDGLVRRCVGTVTLDQARGSFDITCDVVPQHFKKVAQLGSFLQRGGQKIGEKLERLGQKIKDFFQNLAPMEES